MARPKSAIKCLLMSSQTGADFLQPVLKEVITKLVPEMQLDLYTNSDRNAIVQNNQTEKDLIGTITSSDLILVDFEHINSFSFFDIGIARSIGKTIVFIIRAPFVLNLPDFIRQGYFIIYDDKEKLLIELGSFFLEYKDNPKRFEASSLVHTDKSSQIVVDLEKLEQRVFENLCFELLSRLGYKQLEWKVKEEFIDAVSTLRKQDPDGFDYDELWLVSFVTEFTGDMFFDMLLHEPDYFFERILRDRYRDMINRYGTREVESELPVTLLLITRNKENIPKKFTKALSRRESKNRRGYPGGIRIRLWDEQVITPLVQKNLLLVRKYFSSEALIRSGVRLSYEELNKQNADMAEELQNANQVLEAERSRSERLERDAAWKLLSFKAAHRLGNPMDAIDSELSNLKQALAMGKTDVINDIVQSMEIPIESAKSIVSEFRNLSIAQEIKPEEIDSEKLAEMLRYSAKKAIEKNVTVEFHLKKIPNISIDVQKIADCFGELVRNSLHFLKDGVKQITISIDLPKKSELPEKIDRTVDYIKIVFSDNGSGVQNEMKNEIFRPFATSYIHGTGLGLAYCESVIERHGGKIREVGKQGEGAVFEIFLPIIKNKE